MCVWWLIKFFIELYFYFNWRYKAERRLTNPCGEVHNMKTMLSLLWVTHFEINLEVSVQPDTEREHLQTACSSFSSFEILQEFQIYFNHACFLQTNLKGRWSVVIGSFSVFHCRHKTAPVQLNSQSYCGMEGFPRQCMTKRDTKNTTCWWLTFLVMKHAIHLNIHIRYCAVPLKYWPIH